MFSSVLFLSLLVVCSAGQEVETTTGFWDFFTDYTFSPIACEDFDPEFTINEISFDRFSTDSFHDGIVQDDTDWNDYFIYVPTAVLKQIITILGAKQTGTGYSVACDEDSLWSYPDLRIDIDYGTVVSSPWDYLDWYNRQDDVCALLVSDQSPTGYSITLPAGYQDYVCWMEQGATDIPWIQTGEKDKKEKVPRPHRLHHK
ncbi:hypothetical protein M3Y99_00466600 [Aphelenchoides fujianensis]|nr:hypothetical protein M3Y99_00466600 [Aphelenchoides fujianensis]